MPCYVVCTYQIIVKVSKQTKKKKHLVQYCEQRLSKLLDKWFKILVRLDLINSYAYDEILKKLRKKEQTNWFLRMTSLPKVTKNPKRKMGWT